MLAARDSAHLYRYSAPCESRSWPVYRIEHTHVCRDNGDFNRHCIENHTLQLIANIIFRKKTDLAFNSAGFARQFQESLIFSKSIIILISIS